MGPAQRLLQPVFAAAVLACAPAAAQANPFLLNSAAAKQPAAQVSLAPKPPYIPATHIALPRLAASAQEALARLQAIQEGLQATAVGELDERLSREESAVNALPQVLGPEDLVEVPFRVLEGTRRQWTLQGLALKQCQSDLEKNATSVQSQRDELRTMGQLWSNTLQAASGEEAPGQVLGRIHEVQTRIRTVNELLKLRMDRLLLIQDQAAHLRSRVDKSLLLLDKDFAASEQKLFEAESSPLWSIRPQPLRGITLLAELRGSFALSATLVQGFLSFEWRRLLLNAAIVLVIGIALWALRRTRPSTGEPDLTEVICGRPFSASLAVGVFVASWLYAAPPPAFYKLITLLAVIPAARLLPRLAPAVYHPVLIGLGAFLVLEMGRDFTQRHFLANRVLLLLCGCAALTGAAFTLRSAGGIRSLLQGRWQRTIALASAFGALLLMVSMLATIIGNITLADLFNRGVFGAAISAVVLIMGSMILETLGALAGPYLAGTAFLQTLAAREMVTQARWRGFLRTACVVVWLRFSLVRFHLWDSAAAGLRSLMETSWQYGGFSLSVGSCVIFAVGPLLAIGAAKLLRALLNDALLPAIGLPRGVPAAISHTAYYTVLVAGVVISLLAGGLDMGKFGFLAGTLGVGIGFGLQNIVNNFVSGLILLYERPVQVGDAVEAGKVRGYIKRIGLRSSTIRSFEGAEVIVPNASLISAELVNWTLSNRSCRAELNVNVKHGSPPAEVIRILLEVLKNQPDSLRIPAPTALFIGVGPSSLDFLLRFWIPDYDAIREIKSSVLTDVYAALQEAGIEVAVLQQDIVLKRVDPGVAGMLAPPPHPPRQEEPAS